MGRKISSPGVLLGCVVAWLAQTLPFVWATPAAALITVGAGVGGQDVEVRDGLAYAVTNPLFGESTLRVIDVSNPAFPIEIGSLVTDVGDEIELLGDHALVGDAGPPVRVIDVSDPTSPVEVANFYAGGLVQDIDVQGSFAYVASATSGLFVIDLSNPVAPLEVASVTLPAEPFAVEVVDGLALLAAFSLDQLRDELWVFDVSDPAHLIELARIAGGCCLAGDIQVSGTYAYFSTPGALRVIDISDPASPVEIATRELTSGAGLFLDGSVLYVADATRLQLIDVSNPAQPTEFGEIGLFGSHVEVGGGLAFVGSRIVDVSRPAFPARIASLDTPGFASGIAVVDGVSYVADDGGGFRAIDVSDPCSPVEIGVVATPSLARDVDVVDGLAWVADGYAGLRVIDVLDPGTPVEIGAVDTPGFSWGVSVSGETAFIADGESGLRVIDVSDPQAPVEIGSLDGGYRTLDVEAVDGIAYLADESSGLRVIDVSNPFVPVEIGALSSATGARGVQIVGSLGYVAASHGLYVVDVSDPSAPVELGFAGIPLATDVFVEGGLAYVAASVYGVRVIDVTNPRAPFELGGLDTGYSAVGVAAVEGIVYVATLASGLLVYELGPEYPWREVGIDVKPGSARNRIGSPRRGGVRVALLGSQELDVATVDPTRLEFGPNRALAIAPPSSSDVNRDGFRDLVARFRKRETGIVRGDQQACVHGQLLDGTRFEGCDAIRTPPPRL
ncbi:MAG: hypothetical protein L0206_19105 [Actinobacteria bacterium]|nr:hypothetical protein [Actinomycetota bacterium]